MTEENSPMPNGPDPNRKDYRAGQEDNVPWAPPAADLSFNYQPDSSCPEPPIEDRNFPGSFFQALIQTIKRCLLDPQAFFSGMKEDRSALPSLLIAFMVLCISGFIGLVVQLILQSVLDLDPMAYYLDLLRQIDPNFDAAQFQTFQQWGMVANVFLIPVAVCFQIFLTILLLFFSTQIWQTFTGSFSLFARVCGYSFLPWIFYWGLGAIPFLNILVYLVLSFWQFYLLVVALQRISGATQGKAILTVLTPIAFCCICLIFCIGAWLLAIVGAVSGAMSG